MNEELKDFIVKTFKLKENEGPDKVIPLREAVRHYVKPGMFLYLEGESNAAAAEIIRQYHGSKPQFSVFAPINVGGTLIPALIHTGLVKRLIFTNCSDTYPVPSPNPVITRAFRDKSLEMENWSVLAAELRLMAGALGIGFIPTKSMVGSTVAEENKDAFKVIKDPFGSGKKLGAVKACNPDVALVHGWAADRYGNMIPQAGSLTAGCWGAKASKHGVIVTVERLVSTDFIRRHSYLVRLPGYLVNSVSVAPFGAHPQGMSNQGLNEFEGYTLDHDFLTDLRKASEETETFSRFVKEWILNLKDHDEYLRRLGAQRLFLLKGKASRDAPEYELDRFLDDITNRQGYNANEMMMVTACNKIREVIRGKGYKTMFPGIGASALPGWMAYYMLQQEDYQVDMVPTGIGFAPRPANPYLTNLANVHTAKMLPDIIDIHGTCVTGENNSCLGVLGAAEIDKHGNINSSKISDEIFIAGIAGGNDIASGAREVVVVTQQSKRRFVEQVPFISQPGALVTTVVSTMGVYQKLGDDSEFSLTEYFPEPGLSGPQEHIERIKANCGWNLKVAPDIRASRLPTKEDLALLRALDPQGIFIGKKT